MKRSLPCIAALGALALSCASAQFGESYVWKRPCGTDAQRSADRDACGVEAAGLSDPSGRSGEYARDLFRHCMEKRGWQRVPEATSLTCPSNSSN